MSLQRIPHDATKYRGNPVELLDISKRNRIGSEYALSQNTKLLITGIGSNNSTTILDSTGKTVTRYGDTKISTAQSIIGGSSIYFDGTGDYLSLADSADWDFGSGDFTIDFWIRLASVSTYVAIVTKDAVGNRCWIVFYEYTTNKMFFAIPEQTSQYIDTTMSINTWTHVYFGRKSGVLYRGLNGVLQSSSYTSTIPAATNAVEIGRQGATYLNPFIGYISHLRITKGHAPWIENFTPPKYISNNYIGA